MRVFLKLKERIEDSISPARRTDYNEQREERERGARRGLGWERESREDGGKGKDEPSFSGKQSRNWGSLLLRI